MTVNKSLFSPSKNTFCTIPLFFYDDFREIEKNSKHFIKEDDVELYVLNPDEKVERLALLSIRGVELYVLNPDEKDACPVSKITNNTNDRIIGELMYLNSDVFAKVSQYYYNKKFKFTVINLEIVENGITYNVKAGIFILNDYNKPLLQLVHGDWLHYKELLDEDIEDLIYAYNQD